MYKNIILVIIFCMASFVYAQEINDNNVRMFDYPFLSSNVIKVLSKGNQVEIFRKTKFSQLVDNSNTNWYLVRYNDNYGWVFGKYISNINSNRNEIYVSNYTKQLNSRLGKEKALPEDIVYFDYDISTKQFKTISQNGINEVIEENNLRRIKYNILDKSVVWFDPVDIRNSQSTAIYSDLIIRTPYSKVIIYPEKYNINFYWDEVGFIKLTNNGKYLVIDDGTWHIRNISIIDLQNYKVVASGSSVSSIRFIDNSNTIMYVTDPHIEYGYLNAIAYYNKNSNMQDFNGANLKEIFSLEKNKNSDISYYFGNLCIFNAETGLAEIKGQVLFYMSTE